tara:strand:+ start:8287 stop:12909 length:4623 start_codon:yes stop_codon:yes gene_type:complete
MSIWGQIKRTFVIGEGFLIHDPRQRSGSYWTRLRRDQVVDLSKEEFWEYFRNEDDGEYSPYVTNYFTAVQGTEVTTPGQADDRVFQNLIGAIVRNNVLFDRQAQENLSIDNTPEEIASQDPIDLLNDEAIEVYLRAAELENNLFDFWIKLKQIGGTAVEEYTLQEAFLYRMAFQIRYKLAKAIVKDPESDSADDLKQITDQEWKVIEKFPEVISNSLFQKLLVKANDEILNKVLGEFALWSALRALALDIKKFDAEITATLKKFADDVTHQNVENLWVPEPFRGSSGDDEDKVGNREFAKTAANAGIHNIGNSESVKSLKNAHSTLVNYNKNQGFPYCVRNYNDGAMSSRGRSLVIPKMRLPQRDGEDQVRNFFQDLGSVASLKMTENNSLNNTNAYIINIERENFEGLFSELFKDTGIKEVLAPKLQALEQPNSLATIVCIFYSKFLVQSVKTFDKEVKTETLLDEFYNIVEDAAIEMYPIILQNLENAFRVALWKSMTLRRDDPSCPDKDGEKAPSEDEIEKAANDALKNNKDPQIEGELSEKELGQGIDERQRFFKQCALMRNIERLKGEFQFRLENEVKKTKRPPFNGRFFMAKSAKDQSKILNGLVSSKHSAMFFQIPPSIMSYLTPKVKFYKIEEQNLKLSETEFIFPQSTDIDRVKNYTHSEFDSPKSFLLSNFDKGDGVGMKSFSFNFNGTNPAESRNDITADLTLFFQSFSDFVKERISSDGNTYRFVDLIIQPVAGKRPNIPVILPSQYDPSFYRIRAEVGYHVPDNLYEMAGSNFGEKEIENLIIAIQNTNKSFYLNMVDHDITVNVDGSVEIKISYRAYIESALKSPRFDALLTPQLLRKKRQNTKNLQDLIDSGRCSVGRIQEFKALMDAEEQILRKKSLQSIIRRIIRRKKLYNIKVNEQDAKHFRKNGFFKKCRLTRTTTIETCDEDTTEIIDFYSSVGISDSEEIDHTDAEDCVIQFFYFGDLLYTIMDTMFTRTNGTTPTAGAQNMSIILGSFDLDAFGRKVHGINVAELPISLDYFTTWFTDNVLTKGSTRKTFPILNFIRNLSNNLIQKSLLESCSNISLIKNLRFHTGQITAYSKSGENPLLNTVGYDKKDDKVNLFVFVDGGNKKDEILPLKGDASGVSKIDNFYNYMFLNVVGSNLSFTGTGNYADDIDDGRFHVHVGSNRGIVKSISFEKTDIEYVREARMFQNGIDGLLQLSNVYIANVEMFGNTIFYPGMELYINPYGIGGTVMGAPNKANSIANKLGFGGYHTIVGVNSSITPGKFSTTIRAQWYYSGDGRGSPDSNGQADDGLSRFDPDKLDPLASHADNKDAGFCTNAVIEMQADLARLESGDSSGFSISDVGETRIDTTLTDGDPVDNLSLKDAPVEDIPEIDELDLTEEEEQEAREQEAARSEAETRSETYVEGGNVVYSSENAKLWQDAREYLENQKNLLEVSVEVTDEGLVVDGNVIDENILTYENVGDWGSEKANSKGTPKYEVTLQTKGKDTRQTYMDTTELFDLLQKSESTHTPYELNKPNSEDE